MGTGAINFNAVKVFSTTLARDREAMGENITRWLKDNNGIEIVDKEVTQSSDKEFHCLTITFFYRLKPAAPAT
jgi:folate-dependent tRNA-U54 methylase TrmFO/GidA